jgi:protein ImuB
MEFSANTARRRLLALWLPLLPTDRLRRKGAPDTASLSGPLIVSRKDGNVRRVHAADRKALALGLRPGMALADAQAMVEGLCIVPADETRDGALLENLVRWCERYTPFAAPDGVDGVMLDITGAAHLFGGESAMLQDALRRLAILGFTARGAIAGTAAAAHALAHFAPGAIAPPGGEDQALAPLPVAAIPCDPAIHHALRRAGFKNVGQVKARGRAELASRFGMDFLARFEHLLAKRETPLNPRHPLPDFTVERNFADPVATHAVVTDTLEMLAQNLCALLEREGRGGRLWRAVFFRADGTVRHVTVRTGTASREAAFVTRLFSEKLEILTDPLDPGFGFDLIRLEASETGSIQPATISFDADENGRRQIGFLIDRLAARLGGARVQRFIAQDTHIPEAEAVAVPATSAMTGVPWRRRSEAGDPPRRPLRLLERPEEIRAHLPQVPDGPPAYFRWRQCRHDVVRAEGPERIALDWWREDPRVRLLADDPLPRPERDYFRVETREGQRFWIYRDGAFRQTGLQPRWYMHGLFA